MDEFNVIIDHVKQANMFILGDLNVDLKTNNGKKLTSCVLNTTYSI